VALAPVLSLCCDAGGVDLVLDAVSDAGPVVSGNVPSERCSCGPFPRMGEMSLFVGKVRKSIYPVTVTGYDRTYTPAEKWGFVMLNPDQQRVVMKAIKDGPLPLQTLMVWNACISFIAYDRDGEIAAKQAQIAEAADVTATNTSTALSRLVEIGVLIRTGRGRYKVNSHVAWSGPLHKRELAAKEHQPLPGPLLVVMEGGTP